MNTETPLVSVHMITYNHEKFISQAIEGVLNQKCDFNIQLVIGEDCSTDQTRRICDEYAAKHPGKIKLLPSLQNFGMIKNGLRTLEACTGNYIAHCEGDDYWIDPYKLQKQVSFLEANPEYVLSHTELDILFQSDGRVEERINRKNMLKNQFSWTRSALLENLLGNKVVVRTCTAVFRKTFVLEIHNKQSWINIAETLSMGDIPRWIEFSQLGPFHYLDEVTAVYRVSQNSVSRPNHAMHRADFAYKGALLRLYYAGIYPVSFSITRKLKRNAIIHELNYLSFQESRLYRNPNGFSIGVFYRIIYWLLSDKLTARLIRKVLRTRWLMDI